MLVVGQPRPRARRPRRLGTGPVAGDGIRIREAVELVALVQVVRLLGDERDRAEPVAVTQSHDGDALGVAPMREMPLTLVRVAVPLTEISITCWVSRTGRADFGLDDVARRVGAF